MTSRAYQYAMKAVIGIIFLSVLPFASLTAQQPQSSIVGAVAKHLRVQLDTTHRRGVLTDTGRTLMVDPRPSIDLAAAQARRPAQLPSNALHASDELVLPPGLRRVQMLTPSAADTCRVDLSKCLPKGTILIRTSTAIVIGNSATISVLRDWQAFPDPSDGVNRPEIRGDSWLLELTRGASGWQVVKATLTSTSG